MLKEFRDFIMRGNVVDLAVGIVAGAAFGGVVNSLVANVVNPIIAFIIGSPDFNTAMQIQLPQLPWAEQPATIMLGALVTTLITFLGTMAGVFFFIVKPMNTLQEVINKDDESTEEEVVKPELVAALEQVRFVQDTDGSWSVSAK